MLATITGKPFKPARTPKKGRGWLERKASGELVYHTPWTARPKPFTMLALKPRMDSGTKTFDRMKADIDKAVSKMCVDRASKMPIGQSAGDGYEIVAADGHRALLKEGAGNGGNAFSTLGELKGYTLTALANPEFQLAIKRATVAVSDEILPVIRLDCASGTLTISAKCEEVEFDETLEVTNTSDWSISLNPYYLDAALGTWPLHVWIKDKTSAVVIEPTSREWRYVLMPVRQPLDAH